MRELSVIPEVEGYVGVLVDDYNADLPADRAEAVEDVIRIGLRCGIEFDYVQFESDGEQVGFELLSRATEHLAVDLDGQRLRRLTRAEDSSVLVAETTRLCCPTLAATWVLARLGVEPYVSAYVGAGPFTGERLLTVLPVRFMRVETTVVDLLNAAGYSKAAKKVGYVFY